MTQVTSAFHKALFYNNLNVYAIRFVGMEY
jgi:hypothetical protein